MARNPITYLVEAADDIVNVCIDLEDGIRKRVFRWPEMIEELERHGAGGEAHGLEEMRLKPFVRKSGLGGLNVDVVLRAGVSHAADGQADSGGAQRIPEFLRGHHDRRLRP